MGRGRFRGSERGSTRASSERYAAQHEHGELNANLAERFRGNAFAARSNDSRPSAPPHVAGALTQDVLEYFTASENMTRQAKWQQLQEIPTTAELLLPSPILLQGYEVDIMNTDDSWGNDQAAGTWGEPVSQVPQNDWANHVLADTEPVDDTWGEKPSAEASQMDGADDAAATTPSQDHRPAEPPWNAQPGGNSPSEQHSETVSKAQSSAWDWDARPSSEAEPAWNIPAGGDADWNAQPSIEPDWNEPAGDEPAWHNPASGEANWNAAPGGEYDWNTKSSESNGNVRSTARRGGGDSKNSDDDDEVADRDSQEQSQLKVFNKVKGAWPSKDKYLRTHYKLLRENALRELREAIETLKAMPIMQEEKLHGDIGLYDDVRVKGVTFSRRGLGIKVTFSLSRVGKRIFWGQSKRLMSGSLVVLIPYEGSTPNVGHLKVAVIAARPIAELEYNPPQLDLFFARPEELEIDGQKKWLMLEARGGFFEAERHTLIALQKMMSEDTPLVEHLVSAQTSIPASQHLLANPTLDLRSVFETSAGRRDILKDWPENPQTDLDATQQQALKQMLTKQLALVQGPPGTGKTHVSVKALRILMDNHRKGDPPIVITCHTNHALDQLLRHVALVEPACFVRLGGRSKDYDIIKPRTLFEVRERMPDHRSPILGGASKDFRALLKEMKEVLRLVLVARPETAKEKETSKEAEEDCPITLDVLSDYGILTQAQCQSIEQSAKQWVKAGRTEAQQASQMLFTWAGVNYSCRPPTSTQRDIFEYEEAEQDQEELQEIEAENAPVEDDEADNLMGDYFDFRHLATSTSVRFNPEGQVKLAALKNGVRKVYKSPEKLLAEVQDLGKVNAGRPVLLDYLIARVKETICANFRSVAANYADAVQRRKIGLWTQDSWILKQHKVVGLTTTGFSKYRALIASLKPRFVMIEEAAEALEGPVMAACLPSLQHLILVGDHKQLKPHIRVHGLEGAPYNLDTSLFERLIENDLEYTQMQHQRRMVPEIRRLLAPIYGDGVIKDNPDVLRDELRPPVPGMKFRTWFYDHAWEESRDDQMSCYNPHEANMIVGLVKYFYMNAVPLEYITILTFYNGQRREILRQLRNANMMDLREYSNMLKIVTVDSYQGEENHVVLLSLVRSNLKESIGFLSNLNRVCVSMSRAQRGFYIFGNSTLLRRSTSAPFWREIYEIMKKGDAVQPQTRFGKFKLPIGPCVNHNGMAWIKTPTDWENNDGGCDAVCGYKRGCGHVCTLHCHRFDHSILRCVVPCQKPLPCGHPCKLQCSDVCQCIICAKGPPSGFDKPSLDEPQLGRLVKESMTEPIASHEKERQASAWNNTWAPTQPANLMDAPMTDKLSDQMEYPQQPTSAKKRSSKSWKQAEKKRAKSLLDMDELEAEEDAWQREQNPQQEQAWQDEEHQQHQQHQQQHQQLWQEEEKQPSPPPPDPATNMSENLIDFD